MGEPRWETTLLLCELEMFFFPFPVTSGAAEQHSTVGLRRVRRHSPRHRAIHAHPSMAMGVMVIAVAACMHVYLLAKINLVWTLATDCMHAAIDRPGIYCVHMYARNSVQ
jgi:hypothetical protein